MEAYKYDEESVKTLIEWAKATNFPQEITMSEAEKITDVKRYVSANLSDIKMHYPEEFYFPAITRLYRLKEKMEEREQ